MFKKKLSPKEAEPQGHNIEGKVSKNSIALDQLQNLVKLVNKGIFHNPDKLDDFAIKMLTDFIKETSDESELKLLKDVYKILTEYSRGHIKKPRSKEQRLLNKQIKSKISHFLNAFTNIIVFHRVSRWQKIHTIDSQIKVEQSDDTYQLF